MKYFPSNPYGVDSHRSPFHEEGLKSMSSLKIFFNWEYGIERLVKQVSILWHVLIPEFQGIPTNSVFVQFRNKKEFRGSVGN